MNALWNLEALATSGYVTITIISCFLRENVVKAIFLKLLGNLVWTVNIIVYWSALFLIISFQMINMSWTKRRDGRKEKYGHGAWIDTSCIVYLD